MALVTARLLNELNPPTAPLKEIMPPVPAPRVNAVVPSRVLEKLIFAPAPALLEKVGDPEIETGPVIVIVPVVAVLVVILPPTLMAVGAV